MAFVLPARLSASRVARAQPPAALYLLVAISGAAGLSYELLWIRALGLHFGTTAPAITTVVAVFMAGLGAGNWLFGARADRSRRPFALYQQLEFGIGISGLLVSLFVLRGGRWLDGLSRVCEYAGALSGGLRALLFSALMLLPATLMGGTLPVLSRALLRRGHSGSGLGLLYACNTLGAIAGALAPDFLLIPRHGLTLTAFAVAGGNLCVALGVRSLAAAGALSAVAIAAEPAGETTQDPARGAAGTQRAIALTLTACSGFAAMGLEVLWSRTVQHWTAALVTSFAVVLAVYLATLALGALATRRIADHAARPLRAASFLLGAAGLAALVPIACAYAWRDLERALWPRASEMRRLSLWAEAVDALLHASYLEAVPCLLMGASFPFVAAAFLRDGRPGAQTGQLLTTNTFAGVLGALGIGFVALPELGEQRSYCAVAVLLCAVAALCSGVLGASFAQRISGTLAFGLVLVVAAWLPRGALLRAHFRSGGYVLKVREGSTTTAAAAIRRAYGQPYYAELLTPGVSMSNTGPPSRRYMSMMAHAALFSARGSERALLICYGVGNTASALLSHAELARLDVVDISREVLGLAPQFARALGNNPLRDPRVHVFVNDGRHHLIVHEQRYDVITAEPPPPNHAGVANLYSREFYRLAKSRLSPGGVITQWLPEFELSTHEVRAMIAAFASEFEHTALLYGYKGHLILIGSQSPLAIDTARARQSAAQPALAHNLQRSGIGDLDDVLGSVVMTDAELRREVRGVPPVTDDLPSIQYPYESVRADTSYTAGLALNPAHAFALLGPQTDAATRARALAAWRATAAAVSALPLLQLEALESAELAAGTALQPALHSRPENAGLWCLLGLDGDHVRAAEAALSAGSSPHPDAQWTLMRRAFYAGQYAEALGRLATLAPQPDELALGALFRGGCMRALGQTDESAAAFRQAAQASHDPRFKAAALQLAARAATPFTTEAGPWSTSAESPP
jgi:spermidine synthase